MTKCELGFCIIALVLLFFLLCYTTGKTSKSNALFTVGNYLVNKNQSGVAKIKKEDWQYNCYLDGVKEVVSSVRVDYDDCDLYFKIKTPRGLVYVPSGTNHFFLGEGKRKIWVSKGDKIISHNIITIIPPREYSRW